MPRPLGLSDFATRALALILLAALSACSGAGSLLPGHRA
ncbi:MAG: hypothetical protein JWM87_4474, partial [Candidatus Eremiobacteraeota bacterium]|nr:hypothetical protein [Candidatus Eremiobacteraeota bacterium]